MKVGGMLRRRRLVVRSFLVDSIALTSIIKKLQYHISAHSVTKQYRTDFSVPQQYRICTLEYRKGTRASSRLVPKFRNCTLCNGGEPRYCRGTDRELQSSVPLSTSVPKLYSAKRGNRGTAEVHIGNASHQHTRSTAAGPNKQLRNGDLS